jgi:DNA-binding FadR family transcriptional regulator
MEPHYKIVRAIEKKDAEDARSQARMHVSYSVQDYEAYIGNSGGKK